MNILITNIASATATSLIKILRMGKISDITIWGTESQKYGYCSGSILVDHYIQVPSVIADSYIDIIKNICIDNNIDVLIPILDEELYLFSKAHIDRYVKITLPNLNIINLFRNKLSASIALSNINSEIIPQIYCSSDSISSDKVIIRKKESIGSQGIVIKTRDSISPEDFNNPEYFVQEFIDGPEYTVDVLCNMNGEIKVCIPRMRLQIKNGISTKAQIIKDEELIDICKVIYNTYCIPGLSNVQFKRKDKSVYFLELNMRFAGMGIAGILSSYDYISDYLLYLTADNSLGDYNDNMNKVRWGSVICRYYEETILV